MWCQLTYVVVQDSMWWFSNPPYVPTMVSELMVELAPINSLYKKSSWQRWSDGVSRWVPQLGCKCMEEKFPFEGEHVCSDFKCELSSTLNRTMDIEHFISKRTHKSYALRFWVKIMVFNSFVSLFLRPVWMIS
jgi:hypothetical protein